MTHRLAAFAIAGLAALSAPAAAGSTLFHGGRIVLNDAKGTVVEALLVIDGRVVSAGSASELEAAAQAAEAARVDLAGATGVPGLQDGHGRLEAYANSLNELDLSTCRTYPELIERVRQAAQALAPGTWVRGRGWKQELWPEAFPLEHLLLSQAVPAHPVFLVRDDGGAALVNQPALSLARLDGVLGEEPKVAGGRVPLDAEGRARGVLIEAAMELVLRHVPALTQDEQAARFLAAQERLLGLGLTCVHDMGASREYLHLLEELRAKDELRLRVVAFIDGMGQLERDSLAGLPIAPDPLDLLAAPGIHLQLDGPLPARRAALLEGYSDELANLGALELREEVLTGRLMLVGRAGLQPVVSATGDRGVRLVLNAYERLAIAMPGFQDLRPRVEGALVVAPKDWQRFPQIGVIPSLRPGQSSVDATLLALRLGTERARSAQAWRALAPQLGPYTFGSGFPAEDPDPLRALHAARTRACAVDGKPLAGSTQADPLSGPAALAGATSCAAYAVHQEDRRGRLMPGFFCDMTVLSVDPTSCTPAELLGAQVLMTVVNGVPVWRPAGN